MQYIYQSIATILAECETIDNQELIDLIMTKLINNLVDLNDYNICPLYECLAEAVEKFGQRAIKYIQIIYQAIIQSMNGYVQSIQNGKTRYLYQQKEILKRSFDLCVKIIDITKERFLELTDQSFLQIVDLALYYRMQNQFYLCKKQMNQKYINSRRQFVNPFLQLQMIL